MTINRLKSNLSDLLSFLLPALTPSFPFFLRAKGRQNDSEKSLSSAKPPCGMRERDLG